MLFYNEATSAMPSVSMHCYSFDQLKGLFDKYPRFDSQQAQQYDRQARIHCIASCIQYYGARMGGASFIAMGVAGVPILAGEIVRFALKKKIPFLAKPIPFPPYFKQGMQGLVVLFLVGALVDEISKLVLRRCPYIERRDPDELNRFPSYFCAVFYRHLLSDQVDKSNLEQEILPFIQFAQRMRIPSPFKFNWDRSQSQLVIQVGRNYRNRNVGATIGAEADADRSDTQNHHSYLSELIYVAVIKELPIVVYYQPNQEMLKENWKEDLTECYLQAIDFVMSSKKVMENQKKPLLKAFFGRNNQYISLYQFTDQFDPFVPLLPDGNTNPHNVYFNSQ